MKRVNLLSTDQPSSGSKMATTGHSTPSGSTRTKAGKGLFSHFMFLSGFLLIALLTSGKALATNYTITLTGTGGLSIQGGSPTLTQPVETKTFTLVAEDGYTLPAAAAITVTGKETINNGDGPTLWSYNESNGEITLGSSVDLTGGSITVAADGVEKDIATLKTFTYQLDGNSAVAVTDFVANVHNPSGYTVPIQDFTKSIQLAGEVTDNSGAEAETPRAVDVLINSQDGTGSATAELKVTAKDGTLLTYTVNFTFNKAKIQTVTAPEATKTLESRVESEEEVIAELPATVEVTTDDITVTSLPIKWEYKGGGFDPAAGAVNTFTWTATVPETLDVNDKTITDDVRVTNAAASDDAKLKTLTYSVEDGDQDQTVNGFTAGDNGTSQAYTVTLDKDTPDGKTITVVATTNDDRAVIEDIPLTATLSDAGTAEISFTVTAENEDVRTITITFNRAKSNVVTLSKLQYQVDGGELTDVDGFDPTGTDGAAYPVVLSYKTSATAAITIVPTPTDAAATITGNDGPITLLKGSGKATFTVTAADGETNQEIEINFTTAKEKITAIQAPTLELTANDAKANADAVKEKVDAIKKVIATSESGAEDIELDVTWVLKGGQFTDVPGAKNTYTWTATSEVYDLNGYTSGDMVVVNYVAAFTDGGESKELKIGSTELVNQIGDGQAPIALKSVTVDTPLDALAFDKATVGEGVTINDGKEVGELTFNETTVTGKIDLQGSVPSVVLNNATIGEIALATGKTTTLSLQATGNSIAKITNEGTLTLNDAADVTPLSLAVETKAAQPNKDIDEVVNNGTFTDNTARIVTVKGATPLSITTLPKSQSTTGNKVTLTVAADATNAPTYQWQKYSDGWQVMAGATDASLTIEKVQNGSTNYRCEVKSTNSAKSTTLYTPAVTVRFYTSTPDEPSTPSTPTYTVSLDKVTGATFSKGETTTVDEGDNFSFKITLDKDYDQSKPVVTVDGTAITADADGNYTIKNIQKDIKIMVSGIVKNTATGIEETVADAPRAWSVGSTLYIHVPETADVYVISGTGAMQQHLRGVSGDRNMQLRGGFYIVRIGNVSQKVIIR
ncbi:MAG: hypothetical protein ACK5N4_06115 [Parabacteroides gordonii]|uniref:hypothetical protein n=1 Tax=Parabacteroides gordonii TaxID=574930 RepID=UPI003A8987E7